MEYQPMFRISLKKAAVAVATGVLAISGLLAGTGGAAQANGPSMRIAPYLNQFLFLDVSGGSVGDGAPIVQWPLSGDNQVFTLQPTGGHFELVNRHSGKCITSDGVPGHQLVQWYCSGTSNQLWDTGLTPGFYIYTIRNVGSGLYMDVEGGSVAQGGAVITWYGNGGSNQYFAGLGA
jgi:hypothetical protein